ncbi:MAG: peptide chain release factor N(5)-glutamine methyltransferase [Candidatus Goldiibacteriota bacterium]
MNKNTVFLSALRSAAKIIRGSGMPEAAAYSEAKSLLSYAAGIEYNRLPLKLNDNLNRRSFNRVMMLAEKRAEGYPLQYITGVQDFYGRDFTVKKGVFIPRFDTQALIDEIKAHMKELPDGCTAAECGCGTGIISITMLLESDKIKKMLAYDISKRAAANTRINARTHGCMDRLRVYEGDFFKMIQDRKEKIPLIVSNPPYIDKRDMDSLPKDVLKEPKKALYGSFKGLSYYKRLAGLARSILPENGLLALETGDGMERSVVDICEKQGLEFLSKGKDAGGNIRAIVLRKQKNAPVPKP